MSDLQHELSAFHDELVKEGAHPALTVARQVLSKGVQKAAPLIGKLRPAGVLEAAHMGVRGIRGAAGAVGRAPGAAGKGIASFGKRQLHGMTGWMPKGQAQVSGRHGASRLESIGFSGSKASRKGLRAAEALEPGQMPVSWGQRIMRGRSAGSKEVQQKVKERAVARAEKLHGLTKETERMRLTSLPGWAKSLATEPRAALKAGLGREWRSGMMGKAMIGLPVGAAGHQLLKPSQEGGPGRLERAGKSVGEVAWGMGLPILPAMAAAHGISRGAGAVGRFAGRKRKPELGKHPAPPSIDAGGQTQPAERIMTPAAAGQPPEDGIA